MRPKPSFANVIALLALFVSLGGTVYAAATINGKSIRRNSIPADRLKKDSVGGAQVREAALGTVPNAASAEEAARAGQVDRAKVAGVAESAARAEKAGTAAKAALATEADHAKTADLVPLVNETAALGGKPASAYRRECEDGTIKGFLLYNPVTNQKVSEFNCARGGVTVTDPGTGFYEVTFEGLRNAAMAVVSTPGLNTEATARGVTGKGPELFGVQVQSTSAGGRLPDEPFAITVF